MDSKRLTGHLGIKDENSWETGLPDFPQQIYVGCLDGYCNLNCNMCVFHAPRVTKDLKKFKGRMPLEKYNRIMDEAEGKDSVIYPYRYSEPLLIKDLFARIKSAKERNLGFIIDTNGLLLTAEHAEFFVDNKVDSITFSIDSITKETLEKIRGIDKLEKIKKAVFTMLRARGDGEYPRIGVSFVLMDENRHEMQEFVDYWIKYVDVVRVNKVISVNNVIDGIELPKERVPCYCLFSRIVIDFKGDATICTTDAFSTIKVGNVFEDGVGNVWKGDAFNTIRRYHETNRFDKIPLCKDCDGWADYAYTEEVEDGVLIRETTSVVFYNRIDRLDRWKIPQKGRSRHGTDAFVKNNSWQRS